jgi:DNA repair protein RadC
MKLIREINDNYIINQPTDIKKYINEFMNEDREYIIILGLDTKNKVLYRDIISIGNLNSSILHPREAFKNAFIYSANSIIFIHNHPSGDVTPSSDDIDGAKRLKKAGRVLGIPAIDNIIIGNNKIESYNNLIDID